MAIGLFDSSDSFQSFPRSARASESGADRFKTRSNSVSLNSSTTLSERVELRTCRCWSRCCQGCAPILGRRVQSRLLAGVRAWKNPRMMTLTVDRSHFAGPEDAYKKITEGRFLPRLMEALGVDRWVRVLEFQMKTGEGWPHWHVLIDKEGRRGHVDYREAWRLWHDTWGIGGLDVTNNKRLRDRPVADVIRYLCKYMVKFPEKGFPSWVLALCNVRFVQGSRNVGALVSGSHAETSEGVGEGVEVIVDPGANEEVDGKRTKLFSRSIRERVAGCGEVSSLFTCGDGEGKYISRVPVRLGQVVIAAKMGLLAGVSMETRTSEYGKQFLSVFLTPQGGETMEEMVYRVQEGVALLLHAESTHIKPPSHEQEGGCDSESAASGCASVTDTLALWRKWLRSGKLFSCEQEALEGAIAEPDDAYLRGLIEEEEALTLGA